MGAVIEMLFLVFFIPFCTTCFRLPGSMNESGSESLSKNSYTSNSGSGSESYRSHQSDGDCSSDNGKSNLQYRNKVKSCRLKDNLDIYGTKRSARSRHEQEKQGRSRNSRKGLKKSESWDTDVSESDSDIKVSPTPPSKHGGQKSIHVRKKKPARRRQFTSEEDESTEACYNESRSRTATRCKGDAACCKESNDEQTYSSDLFEVDQDEQIKTEVGPEEQSKTIERILDFRRGKKGATGHITTLYNITENGDPNKEYDPDDDNSIEFQYLIKWQGQSHIHNTWESEGSLCKQKVKGLDKLEDYVRKEWELTWWKKQADPIDLECYECESKLQKELLKSYNKLEIIIDEQTRYHEEGCTHEYFCKWQSLPCSESTWEDSKLIERLWPAVVENFKSREAGKTNLSRHVLSTSGIPRWFSVSRITLFGLGHIFNDLCATMWFTYMMLFFQAVLTMRPVVAGAMLLLGQVVDAMATPTFGLLANKIGTMKIWHLIGSLVTFVTFPPLFIRCIGCWINRDRSFLGWWMPLYYGVIIVIFQIGWAIVQISHLAMIPMISENSHVRTKLTSIRYMGSAISSIVVYVVTWIVLKSTAFSSYIGPMDDYKFRDVSLIITAIGVTATVLFQIFFKLDPVKVDEDNGSTVKDRDDPLINEEEDKSNAMSEIVYFLKMPLLYITSLLYVFSRLYWALSLVYIPLFLEERLAVNPEAGSQVVASVPLVLFIASFFFSLMLRSNMNKMSNLLTYLVGSLLSLASCIWIALAIHPRASMWHIYVVAIIIGAGSAITMVASLSITADLIGSRSHQAAAIYSIVTFADKLISGLVVILIENHKCENAVECPQFYRGVLTYACGGCVVLGILTLLFQKLFNKFK